MVSVGIWADRRGRFLRNNVSGKYQPGRDGGGVEQIDGLPCPATSGSQSIGMVALAGRTAGRGKGVAFRLGRAMVKVLLSLGGLAIAPGKMPRTTAAVRGGKARKDGPTADGGSRNLECGCLKARF